MATVTKPATRRPARPARGTCRLTLTINGTRYWVRPIACDREAARQCFELRKANGTAYHVSRHDHGAECTCADFVFHRDGRDPRGCKHVRALVALGMLDVRPDPYGDLPGRHPNAPRGPMPRRPTTGRTGWDDSDQRRHHGGV